MSARWQAVQLGEVATPISRGVVPIPGKTYRQIGVKLWGEGAYERELLEGGQTKYTQLFRTEPGDIIVNKIWARNGSVAVVPPSLAGCYASGEFPMFAPKADRLDSGWVHWLTKTQSFWDQCDGKSRGTSGKNRIRPEEFLRVEVPLPPLSEQRRLVARIEELAEQMRAARALRCEATMEAQAIFESSVGAMMTGAEKFPKGRLGNLTSKIGSGSTPRGGRASYPAMGIPFIRSLNVRMRTFQWTDIAYISPETHAQMAGTHVCSNDVLLNITGASIGRVACAPNDLDAGNVSQHVAIIRPRELLESRFLMFWLSQPAVQGYISGEQKGATRQGFTKAQIEAFSIPIPPLPEQCRIVAYLDELQKKINSLKALQAETSVELDALMPSILDRAFRGEL